eukprot:825846-Alexandrium_andersonii.AAC.1
MPGCAALELVRVAHHGRAAALRYCARPTLRVAFRRALAFRSPCLRSCVVLPVSAAAVPLAA